MQRANEQQPASDGRTDAECFVLTRELLDVSEYELFRRAHRFWYGREADAAALDAAFGAFLRGDELPAFVRHFVRRYVAGHGDEARAIAQRERRAWRLQRAVLGFIAVAVAAALLWGAWR